MNTAALIEKYFGKPMIGKDYRGYTTYRYSTQNLSLDAWGNLTGSVTITVTLQGKVLRKWFAVSAAELENTLQQAQLALKYEARGVLAEVESLGHDKRDLCTTDP